MNKFILIALVATAFAAQCATNQELLDSNFDDYKLKYKFTKDGATDWKTAKTIGFDKTTNITADMDTTFKIKGFPVKDKIPAGFRIYSQDKKKVFSWNQATLGGGGYYMFDTTFDKTDKYTSGGSYSYYTLFNYNEDNQLEYQDSTQAFTKALQVYKGYNGTQIYQNGGEKKDDTTETSPTQFCFVKVTTSFVKLDSTTSNCPAGGYFSITTETECTSAAKNLNLKFNGSTNDSFRGDVPPGCYHEATNNVGVWFNPNSDSKADGTKYNDYPICSRTPPTCEVDDFVTEMEKVKAEVKDPNCKAGSTIQENDGCEASCKNGFKGDKVKYTCKDGKFTAPQPIDCKAAPVPKTCAVDDQTPKLGLNAEFKAKECGTGKTIDSGKTCTATCKAGKTGTVTTAKYTCNDGKLTSPTTIDCNKDSTTTCKVDDFSNTLQTLKAEFKEAKCTAGNTIQESDGCEASCKNGFKGDKVNYICGADGNIKAETNNIVCTVQVSKTCAVDDQTPKLTGLNAEFKAKECGKGKTIDSGKTCTATCKKGKTGTVTTATYTCNDGVWKNTTTIDCSKASSFVQIGVLGALFCLFVLN